MTNESRPHLKIPEVREPEDRTFYGGGGGTYNRESYRRHGEQIFSEAQSLIQRFESNLDKTVTNKRYFRVELPDDKNVWQSDGKKIAENLHGTLIGSPKKNVGHFSTLAQSFTSLTSEIEQYKNSERGKTKFSEIESINSIPLEEKITESLKYIFESNQYKGEAILSMFPDLNRPEILALKQAISDYLDDNDGAIIAEERMGDSSTFRVKAEKETLENLANYFLAIQTVDPVEEVVVESAIAGPRIEEDVLVEPNRSNAKACIFDSGVVENSRFLDSSIISREEPIGPAYNTAHGTFVASRIIYGNDLRGGISTRQLRPDVKVLSVCMISHDEIGNPLPANGDNFIRIIRDTVERWHDQIRVYNLSMNMVFQGTESASIVTDDHVSPVAAEIDKLSKEYGVLFVLSSGNIPITSLSPTPSEPYPEYFLNETSRICRPSESMLALTCGSFSDRANAGSLAQQSHPSPFTRRGPGFNGYRKPDLVCPGGNYASGWSHFDDIAVAGIGADGNRLDYGNGTSFSAPLITRLAAQLFEMMPNSGPELVRALLVHFSELP
ncbi:MAG: S8 family peptidase, partial [Halobacteriovoraceae bacterium]|nr:S8 family peptidase [Halobacteriovoraceae bacterium]